MPVDAHTARHTCMSPTYSSPFRNNALSRRQGSADRRGDRAHRQGRGGCTVICACRRHPHRLARRRLSAQPRLCQLVGLASPPQLTTTPPPLPPPSLPPPPPRPPRPALL